MTTYAEKLKDPRWQKKRLEVLKRADWKCEECGDDSRTLHVHHGYYARGRDPWEYEDDSLHCLCESCHVDAQDALEGLRAAIGKLQLRHIERVSGYVRGCRFAERPGFVLGVPNRRFAAGLADALGVRLRHVVAAMRDGLARVDLALDYRRAEEPNR